LLLKNETPSGNWLQVSVQGKEGVNRMGVGAKVQVFPAGQADGKSRIGEQEIRIGYGYCSGQEAVAHFGLGKTERVDLVVELPHGKGKVAKKNVAANQRIVLTP